MSLSPDDADDVETTPQTDRPACGAECVDQDDPCENPAIRTLGVCWLHVDQAEDQESPPADDPSERSPTVPRYPNREASRGTPQR
ncbi:hypothetical protein ACFQE1_04305 [Halobium palmae]|uniref:Uncharacterized protein n=1 Tax=Halobium palmae TaxID=1776492 RepID=A0ABD5RXY1_9EURY